MEITTTNRVSRRTRDTLHELTQTSGHSMQQVIEEALELYRRQELLATTNTAYIALREDTDVWKKLEAECTAWDTTLADGLEEF